MHMLIASVSTQKFAALKRRNAEQYKHNAVLVEIANLQILNISVLASSVNTAGHARLD